MTMLSFGEKRKLSKLRLGTLTSVSLRELVKLISAW